MERKTILALLLGLSVFSVFSIGYCSNGPLVYEMDFKNDKFYQSSDRGVLNEFYLYLPADTPLNDGKIVGISRKRNLVPFSESRNYSKGKDYDVYETQFGKIGVSICYDINAKTVEQLKNNGAQIILAPFNDSGFDFIYHNIHRYFPVMKAAECAVPIVVSNEDGISQIIDHNGRIIAELGYGKKGSIAQNIEIKNVKSFYLLFGRYLEWTLFLGIVFMAIMNRLRIFHQRKKVYHT